MPWSFSLGRLAGSRVSVHATFLLLLAWVAFTGFGAGGLPAAAGNVVFICALFACVLAHEFGHALMARRYGIRTPDIVLLPIGGVAKLQRMPRQPGAEIAIALAGPAVNIVIWAVIALGLGVAWPDDLAAVAAPAGNLLGSLAVVNLALALFNMIPAFPMDGGRVLRAALAIRLSRDRATRIAARVGQVMAALFLAWGLWTGSLILPLIAVFIFLAARAETRMVAREGAPWGRPGPG